MRRDILLSRVERAVARPTGGSPVTRDLSRGLIITERRPENDRPIRAAWEQPLRPGLRPRARCYDDTRRSAALTTCPSLPARQRHLRRRVVTELFDSNPKVVGTRAITGPTAMKRPHWYLASAKDGVCPGLRPGHCGGRPPSRCLGWRWRTVNHTQIGVSRVQAYAPDGRGWWLSEQSMAWGPRSRR